MFDHTIFPIASSSSQSRAENAFTKSSGALVPSATIVRPITSGATQKFLASHEAHSTRISAHFISAINQISK